jgi:hypothetical protein
MRVRPASVLLLALVAAVLGVAAACQTTPDRAGDAPATTTVPAHSGVTAPPPPTLPSAAEPVDADVAAAVDAVLAGGDGPTAPEVDRLAMAGDLRQAWLLVDLLLLGDDPSGVVTQGLEGMTGQAPPPGAAAGEFYGDLLLAWDVPAPPGYLEHKRSLYLARDATWGTFFETGAPIDWRTITWGGLDRSTLEPLDDPEVVPTDLGAWLAPDEVVYGVVVEGEARAYPRRVLQVHQVVNDTVGGRPVAVVYCPACDGATAYARDRADRAAPWHLRASGLVATATPLLVETTTGSLVRMLGGDAVTGPLHDEGAALEPIGVRATSWQAWSAAFPETTVVSQDAGSGRVYVADPMKGRMQSALPVGAVDDRLPIDMPVIGLVAPDGTPVVAPVEQAAAALDRGEVVELAGARVVRDAGGLAAVRADDGTPLVTLEVRWFAWDQLHPGSQIWSG